ncbi:uncharacterized protein LOC117123326 isoform X2 [Anneissia japonica]|uniref:uncharacterized protein LOC117123326 isoform X2 n=1 Tax=Anneissia japonica TaxID=1529436 RepID=UPI001425591A|nr:uncharacterized protein LOC117123326 isoform X2 [Anneissia japonica]
MPMQIQKQVDDGFKDGIYYKKQGLGEWHIGEETFNIWDYGGQVIYHGIHKIFMTFMAVYIVVFNLDAGLDEHAMVQDSSGKKYPHHLTNLEFIIYWIQSVYTHSRQLIDDIEREIDLPAIVLVGTHRDSLGDNEEERKRKVEEVFTKISNALEGAPYESHVYHEYFDIEHNCPEIHKNVFKLKNVLEDLMKTLVKPVPLKWMHFRCELQQLRNEKLVCSLQKVKELATTCGIDDEDDEDKDKQLNVLLNFLYDLGEIIYMPDNDALKDKVILDPMEFVGVVKTVITVIPPKLRASDEARSFFVPLRLALEHTSSDKKRQVDSYGTRAISIYHGFCGYLPDELFPMIVTEFINTFEGETDPELAHDRAELYFDQHHHVVLSVVTFNRKRILKTTLIRREAINEAKISLDREPSSEACKTVLNFLEESFKRSQQGSRRGIKYERCIPCFCSKNSTENVHIQTLGKFEKDMLPCGREGMHVVRYKRLFGDRSVAAPKEEAYAKGFGVEESKFAAILVMISNDIEDLTIWKVALSDHIKNADTLQKAKRAIHLFDALIDSEDLKAWDIAFLLETIKLTNVLRLRKHIPNCPCLKNIKITYFSMFRQSVMDFGMDLTEHDIGSIAFRYKSKLHRHKYGSDKWSLIMDLERSLILADDDLSFEDFKLSLEQMELGRLNKWLKR